MARGLYKNYITVLQAWRPDRAAKEIGDFEKYLQEKIRNTFKSGESTVIQNPSECQKMYESLHRIANNTHSKRYPRRFESTSVGAEPGTYTQMVKILSRMHTARCGLKALFSSKSKYLDSLRSSSLDQHICGCSALRQHNIRLDIKTCFSLSALVDKSYNVKNVPHIPVLVKDVIENLDIKKNGVYLDLTFGAGGHTKRILDYCPTTQVYGVDRDPDAFEYATVLQKQYPGRFHPILGKFSELPGIFPKLGVDANFFKGILMDLGVSSMQFGTPDRGFMLSEDGPLDMRMDKERFPNQPTAADILACIDSDNLYKVLKYYGQEKRARLISQIITQSRFQFKRLNTTKELADLVSISLGEPVQLDKSGGYSHPATKTFQALRILVNDELNELEYAIRLAHYYLVPEGHLVAISFHSLEDTILKRHFTGMDLDEVPTTIGKSLSQHRMSSSMSYTEDDMMLLLPNPWISKTKHIIAPSFEEVQSNPKSRSAKLRVAEKNDSFKYS